MGEDLENKGRCQRPALLYCPRGRSTSPSKGPCVPVSWLSPRLREWGGGAWTEATFVKSTCHFPRVGSVSQKTPQHFRVGGAPSSGPPAPTQTRDSPQDTQGPVTALPHPALHSFLLCC